MKRLRFLLVLSSIGLLASCGGNSFISSTNNPPSSESSFSDSNIISITPIGSDSSSENAESSSSDSSVISTPDISVGDVTDAEQIANLSSDGISYSDGKFLITKEGEYSFKGVHKGNIEVNAPDQEVTIILNGLTIESDTNSPIYAIDCDTLKVKIESGTDNYVYDTRSAKTEDVEGQGNGAIYCKGDLKISGSGNLFVVGYYNNGIHSTKDIKFNNTVNDGSKIQVQALNNAVKGNKSITVNSGNLIAISTGGDGLKTEDSTISDKGNQKGSVILNGGTVNIYSCCDGIDAAYDVEIGSSTDVPNLSIFTSNYSEYSDEKVVSAESTMYLRLTSNNTNYRYALLFNKSDGTTEWSNAKYDKSVNSGRTTYYFYEIEIPSNAVSFNIYRFSSNVTENNVENANAKTNSSITINQSLDTLPISISNSTISANSWTTYQVSQGGGPGGQGGPGGSGGFDQGNTDKADYSAKGIKAHNEIKVVNGNINIKAYDDGFNAAYGDTLENEATGLGDVTISGGNITAYCADDGLHADRYLKIEGGNINITNAYEGLEGNQVKISGGEIVVYATDDGLNANKKAGLASSIEVSGGYIDTTVYGGDVDAIDSNGTFTQTGGVVITKGGIGGMSTGLDTDGTATVSGGTFVCFGKPEKTPSTKSGVFSKTYSGSYSAGKYKVSIGSKEYTTTTKYSYSAIYVYSYDATEFAFTKI